MNLMEALIARAVAGGGSAAVTPASVVQATRQMSAQEAQSTRENLGAEPEKLVVTVTDDGQGSYTADKTFSEIEAAISAGKNVEAVHIDSIHSLVYHEYGECVWFTNVSFDPDPSSTEFTMGTCIIHSDDTTDYGYDYVEKRPAPINISGGTATITPLENRIYQCGTLTSLTVTNPPATGSYSIIFTSGATPTTTTFPASILGLEDFSAAANTRYEINVLDGAAVVGRWDVSS